MAKKKRGALIIALVLALLAAIFCLWYTRPLRFDDPVSGVDLPPPGSPNQRQLPEGQNLRSCAGALGACLHPAGAEPGALS